MNSKHSLVERNFKLPTANADDKNWSFLSGQYEILFEQISSSAAVQSA